MPQKWTTLPLPPIGSGGEAGDAAPGLVAPPSVRVLRNVVIVGPGSVRQQPDWLKVATLDDDGDPAAEAHAVCGIFPFATQGDAPAPSAGVAFSFNADTGKIYLHHLGEQGTVLRTLEAYSSYGETLPPQITGFELFGRFYFCEYGREAAGSRKGMAYYDPASGGSVTIPTYELEDGGAGAAPLLFRGISLHRGATILGWGYRDEETAGIDQPHALRFSRYGEPDTWVPDLTDQTAGWINVGSIGIPIVACAMSGPYTIIGKETEVFALDGEWSAEFYYRRIGRAHGPVSTAGMAETGTLAAWMSQVGPALSANGGQVQLLAIDRIQKRMLSYLDLTTCWACHDAPRHRIIWGVRRKADETGAVISSPFLTELLWWDYVRNEFGVSGVPAPIFSLGTIRGTGLAVVGPTGDVSNIQATNVGKTSARITWTPGDTALDVAFEVEYRENGTTPWLPAGTTPAATYLRDLVDLDPATAWDVQVRQIRNGQVSDWVQALNLFSTLPGDAEDFIARPIETTENPAIGAGGYSIAGADTVHEATDEETPADDDGSHVSRVESATVTRTFEVKLRDLGAFYDENEPVVVRVRGRKRIVQAGLTVAQSFKLMDGANEIAASGSLTLTTAYQTQELTLSAGEKAALVGNTGDLRVRVTATFTEAPFGTEEHRVTQIELDNTPD